MKTLIPTVFLLAAFVGPVCAHNGALSLYVDETLTDCDMNIGIFEQATIQLFYVRGNGPDMGRAAEFRFLLSDPMAIFVREPQWSSQIVGWMGSESTGYSITASQCLGVGLPVVYLGDVFVMSLGPSQFSCGVVAHIENMLHTPAITMCDYSNTMISVLGGAFVFGAPCNVATEPSSWGAIKELYR